MSNAILRLRENVIRARNLHGLHSALESMTTPLVDTSDILRLQIVLSVSALDNYMHELTLESMLQVFQGKRSPTDAFLKFSLSANTLISINSGGSGTALLEDEIRQKHSYLSFQQPDRIADAVRLFSGCSLWQDVARNMSKDVTSVKRQLTLIVDRRNKIAHEADLDPSYPGTRWPINPSDANNATDFIAELCETIDIVV